MREPETKDIGGCTYAVAPLPTAEGLRLMARLVKVLGPAASAAAKPGDVFGQIGAALGELGSRLDGDDLVAITQALAKHTMVTEDGKARDLSKILDVHFQGRFDDLFAWVQFALEVNFGPLLGWLRRGASAPGAAAAVAR